MLMNHCVVLFVILQLGRCRLVTEFEKLNRIGEGTYGIVCKYDTGDDKRGEKN